MEDTQGDIWIAACESGLYRYDAGRNKFYTYLDPVLYFSNVVYQDDKQQIWVGTWDRGLVKLKTPYTTGRMQYDRFHLRIAPLQSNSRNSINHYNIKAERLTRFFLLFV